MKKVKLHMTLRDSLPRLPQRSDDAFEDVLCRGAWPVSHAAASWSNSTTWLAYNLLYTSPQPQPHLLLLSGLPYRSILDSCFPFDCMTIIKLHLHSRPTASWYSSQQIVMGSDGTGCRVTARYGTPA